jgi:hypothetical protein
LRPSALNPWNSFARVDIRFRTCIERVQSFFLSPPDVHQSHILWLPWMPPACVSTSGKTIYPALSDAVYDPPGWSAKWQERVFFRRGCALESVVPAAYLYARNRFAARSKKPRPCHASLRCAPVGFASPVGSSSTAVKAWKWFHGTTQHEETSHGSYWTSNQATGWQLQR